MAYKTFQMGCRTSLTSNGIAVVCVLETPSILLPQMRFAHLIQHHSTKVGNVDQDMVEHVELILELNV